MTENERESTPSNGSAEMLAMRFLDLWQANQMAWLADQALNRAAQILADNPSPETPTETLDPSSPPGAHPPEIRDAG